MSILLIYSSLAQYPYALAASGSQGFASSDAWLKILHMEPSKTGGFRSRIDNPTFFFASDGKISPNHELAATIRAFETGEPLVGSWRMPPACAFPARKRLLELNFNRSFPSPPCADREKWDREVAFTSVSLVFSSAYANSPSSMFGHTFLKLNHGRERVGGALLDYTVSFGAAVDTENPFAYAYRGLFGRFRGYFAVTPYYVKINEYIAGENRDLWEYQLDLTAPQLTLLKEHLWELYANSYFDYYFLDENCAFQLLAILEAVNPNWNLVSRTGVFVLPSETMKLVLGEGNVSRVDARPSLRRSLNESFGRMSGDERTDFSTALETGQLRGKESAAVFETLSLYGQFQKFKNKGALGTKEQNILTLALQGLAAESTNASFLSAERIHNRPDLGHSPSTIGAGLAFRDGTGEAWVEGRMGYHELADPTVGYEPTLQIDYLKYRIRLEEEKATWVRFDLIEVFTLPAFNSLDPLLSWHVSLGARSDARFSPREAIEFRFGAGATGELLAERLYVYALPTLNVLAFSRQHAYRGRIQPSLLLGLLGDYSPYKLSAQVEKYGPVPGEKTLNPDVSLRLDQRLHITRNWQLVQGLKWLVVDKVKSRPEVTIGGQCYF